MDTVRNASLVDALAHLGDADHVFVRLALSRDDLQSREMELRSLVIEVLPKVWLERQDAVLLVPWLKDQRYFDCPAALFLCGLLKSSTVRGWFERPQDCSLTGRDIKEAGFPIKPGHETRRVSFSMPEFHDNVSVWHLRSYSLNGAKPVPYPSALFMLTPKQDRHGQHHDDERLVGEDGDTLPSFRAARAELIYGVTNRRDRAYARDDIFAVRVVDARGWLKEVRVKPDSLAVTVGGMEVIGRSYVVAQGADVNERGLVLSHHVSLQLPSQITDEAEVVLLHGGDVLDQVVFYNADHPYPYYAHYPQLIVEREDVFGYEAPPKAEAPAPASGAVIAAEASGQPHPRVFISYSQETPEHRNLVRNLAVRLIEGGVDCAIDVFEVNPPEGWQKWMENKIAWAEHVLVVCTDAYFRRFNGQEVPGKGLGAAWEALIITQALYDQAGKNDKFIPVVFSHEDAGYIPTPLKPTTRYIISDERDFEKLYARLTRQVFEVKPPLGRVRPVRHIEE